MVVFFIHYTPYNKKKWDNIELLFFFYKGTLRVLVEYIFNKKYFIIYITSSL